MPSEELYVTGLAVSWHNQTAYFISLAPDPARKSTDQLKQAGDTGPSMEERLSGIQSILLDLQDKSMIAFSLKRQLYLLCLMLGVLIADGDVYDPKVASWLLDMGEDEKAIQVRNLTALKGL